jgi:hypothetical protein
MFKDTFELRRGSALPRLGQLVDEDENIGEFLDASHDFLLLSSRRRSASPSLSLLAAALACHRLGGSVLTGCWICFLGLPFLAIASLFTIRHLSTFRWVNCLLEGGNAVCSRQARLPAMSELGQRLTSSFARRTGQ